MPIKALADPRTRGIFMDWRDELACGRNGKLITRGRCWRAMLSWAKDRGKITVNPCERGGRVYHGTRVDHVWSVDDEAAFLKHAPVHLHLPLLLALWTGQRQGDLLRLTWFAYDGTNIGCVNPRAPPRQTSGECRFRSALRSRRRSMQRPSVAR